MSFRRNVRFRPDGKIAAVLDEVVTVSPDGSCIMKIRGNTVDIMDAKTNMLIHTLVGHEKSVYSAQFSFKGNRVITGSADGIVKIWSMSTGECLKTYFCSSFHAYIDPVAES